MPQRLAGPGHGHGPGRGGVESGAGDAPPGGLLLLLFTGSSSYPQGSKYISIAYLGP